MLVFSRGESTKCFSALISLVCSYVAVVITLVSGEYGSVQVGGLVGSRRLAGELQGEAQIVLMVAECRLPFTRLVLYYVPVEPFLGGGALRTAQVLLMSPVNMFIPRPLGSVRNVGMLISK